MIFPFAPWVRCGAASVLVASLCACEGGVIGDTSAPLAKPPFANGGAGVGSGAMVGGAEAALGRYREQENGSAIDASGHTKGLPEGDATFTGLRELSQVLASRDEVSACMIRFWSYYAYGQASWPEDGCTYDAITSAAGARPQLRDILLGIVRAPHFTQRGEP